MKFTNNNLLKDGDKVKLNIKSIKSHPDYFLLSDEYKNFIDNNKDTIFTVNSEKNRLKSIVGLREEPYWLFWVGDLKKI